MSKVIIAGDSIVITSSLKLEEIQEVARFKPDALCLADEETGELLYGIAANLVGRGSIDEYGAVFNAANAEGKATITLSVPGLWKEENQKEAIANTLGREIGYINAIEKRLPEALAKIKAERQSLIENMEIVG